MSNCPHRWVGHADGVTCELCGMSLSQEEFVELLNGGPVTGTPVSSAEEPEPNQEATTVKPTAKRGKPATRRTTKK